MTATATWYGLGVGNLYTASVTVASGASAGGVIDMQQVGANFVPVQLIMPATISGDTVSFRVSTDGVNYRELLGYTRAASGGAVSPIQAGDAYAMARYVQIRMGTQAAPVNQTALTTLTWVGRSL